MDNAAVGALCATALGIAVVILGWLDSRQKKKEKDSVRPPQMLPPASRPGWREDTGNFALPIVGLTDRERRDTEDSVLIRETHERVRSMSDTVTRGSHHQANTSRSLQSIVTELEQASLSGVQTQMIADRVRGIDNILSDVRAEIRRLPAEQARELEQAWTRVLRAELAFMRGQPTIHHPPRDTED